MKDLSLSVIIVTHNRADYLKKILYSLESQTVRDFEAIVVVDGSTDHTAEFLAGYKPDNFTLATVQHGNAGRSISRNVGARTAKGDLLIFFDDDMILSSECLGVHLKYHRDNDMAICVGTQFERASEVENDFDLYRFHLTKKWERLIEERKNRDADPYLTAANFSIRKDWFFNLKGFDKDTEVAEDLDLALRAEKRGIKISYNPFAVAYHDNKVDCVTFVRKQIEYNRSINNLERIRNIKINSFEYQPGFMKLLIYNIVSRQFLLTWIDQQYFKYWVPEAVRFKFYDIVITGLSKVYPSRFSLQKPKYHGG